MDDSSKQQIEHCTAGGKGPPHNRQSCACAQQETLPPMVGMDTPVCLKAHQHTTTGTETHTIVLTRLATGCLKAFEKHTNYDWLMQCSNSSLQNHHTQQTASQPASHPNITPAAAATVDKTSHPQH
jgi:hypothetical protein